LIELLKEIEEKLKSIKFIGQQDMISLLLYSDGTGALLTKSIKHGTIKEYVILEYDNLAQFYVKVGEFLGKEVKWKDQ
jgi:hypothetical protein